MAIKDIFRIRGGRRDVVKRGLFDDPSIPLNEITAELENAGAFSGLGILGTIPEYRATAVPAVSCAVRFLSQSLAALPLHVYKVLPDGGKEDSRGGLADLLTRAPNEEQTAMAWREYFWNRVFLRGRCVSVMETTIGGRLKRILTPDPANVQVERVAGKMRYTVRDPNRVSQQVWSAGEVIDIPFQLQPDGVREISPLRDGRLAFSIGYNAQNYLNRNFANSGVPALAIEIDAFDDSRMAAGPKSEEIFEKTVMASIRMAQKRQRQIFTVPPGAKIKSVAADISKQKLVEMQQNIVQQVARIYNIPASFLHDLTRSSYAQSAQADRHIAKWTIMPWAKKFEQELDLKLFGMSSDDAAYRIKHNMRGILRGDPWQQAQQLSREIQSGQITPNEAREMQDRKPLADEGADRLWMQGAMRPLSGLAQEKD